jgi:hypothetical protein
MRYNDIFTSVDQKHIKKHDELKRILNAWTEVLRIYLMRRNDENDFPWLYSERSCVGMLSVAAWQSGGLGLEEWGTQKKRKDGLYRGRNDLYLQIGEAAWYAEAKHAYINLDSKEAIKEKKIEETIEGCRKSADNMKSNPESQNLAITFLAPACKPETSDPEGRGKWKSLLIFLETQRPSFIASFFHSEKTEYSSERPLGIVLFGQYVLSKD